MASVNAPERRHHGLSGFALPIHRLRTLTIAFTPLCALIALPSAQAQTFTVLHNFTGGADGARPYAGLTKDAAGNFYGTALSGGITSGSICNPQGCGTVFKLAHQGAGWV